MKKKGKQNFLLVYKIFMIDDAVLLLLYGMNEGKPLRQLAILK